MAPLDAVQANLHDDLIERSKVGERFAQSELYRLYSKAMYNICYRFSNDRDDAEDILQEAFISAFTSLGSYRGEASFGAWLKRIVVNKAINFVKRKKMELLPLDEVDFEIAEVEQSDDELILNIDKIRDGIQELPDGYRLVFSLYLLEGYDHKEIAEILGITESTSKSQYLRAKRKLKDNLNIN